MKILSEIEYGIYLAKTWELLVETGSEYSNH